LLEALPRSPAVCFGEVAERGVLADGLPILDARLDDIMAAARLGHLLRHRADAVAPCAPLDAVLGAEARGWAEELRLRRALGVGAPAYPFESAFWEAPLGTREALLEDWFRAHPEGAGAVPGFVAAYARRCASR